ncbi:MAG: hypothetical protein ACQEQI_06610 [Bacillota bacterium]
MLTELWEVKEIVEQVVNKIMKTQIKNQDSNKSRTDAVHYDIDLHLIPQSESEVELKADNIKGEKLILGNYCVSGNLQEVDDGKEINLYFETKKKLKYDDGHDIVPINFDIKIDYTDEVQIKCNPDSKSQQYVDELNCELDF